jgi:GNAT superfamily N-acetyltransferase
MGGRVLRGKIGLLLDRQTSSGANTGDMGLAPGYTLLVTTVANTFTAQVLHDRAVVAWAIGRREGDVVTLSDVDALPEHRGMGLGRAMLLALVERAKASGVAEIRATLPAAPVEELEMRLLLFLGAGFEAVPSTDFDDVGRGVKVRWRG